jgi:hypothetical protein
MIIHILETEALKLHIHQREPNFVYSSQGMDNYDMDNVPYWSVNIPVIEDRFTFDTFHEFRYNLPVTFHMLSEMNQSAKFYADKFALLVDQRNEWLKLLDKVRDDHDRRLITVLDTPEIRTTYIAQTNAFDMPSTAIIFNLPILYNHYAPIC